MGGASPLEGRVEIFLGQWGTVCSDNWDLADATVVCHQLGYMRAVGAPRGSAAFGAGTGPSWYHWVQCTGTEMNLAECSKYFSVSGSACNYYYDDAGVVCSSEL